MMINSDTAAVKILRRQDGELEENNYSAKIKIIKEVLHVSFSEANEDGQITNHLLKVAPDGMEWIRSGAGKSKTSFKAGETLPFLFSTPHGDLKLELFTDNYSYTKKDTHEICVSYSIKQGGSVVSQYITKIIIDEL